MVKEKISITISSGVLKEVNDRAEISAFPEMISGRSTIISRDLERYYEVLRITRQQLKDLFTVKEMSLILDSVNGLIVNDAISIRLLWANIEDSISMDHLDKKWRLDGPKLIKKIKSLDYVSSCALIDACERWWNKKNNDKKITYRECLID